MSIIKASRIDRETVLEALAERRGVDGFIAEAIWNLETDEELFFPAQNALSKLDDVEGVTGQEQVALSRRCFIPRDAVEALMKAHYRHLLAASQLLDPEVVHRDPRQALYEELVRSRESLILARIEAAIIEEHRLEPPMPSAVIDRNIHVVAEVADVLRETGRLITERMY